MNKPFINSKLSRRQVLKLAGAGSLALYLNPWTFSFAQEGAAPAKAGGLENFLRAVSPINRALGDVAPAEFSGDEPDRAHKILWDKKGFLASLGGHLPQPSQTAPLVIIGGGIAGLFSAYLLRDYKPIVLEQASRFGGNSKGQSWRGIDYSIGAAYMCEPEEDSDIANICKELGLNELWKLKEGEDPVALSGKIYKEFWSGETSPEDMSQFAALSEYFEKIWNSEEEGFTYPDIPVVDSAMEASIKELDRVPFKKHLEKIAGGTLHPQIETAIEHYCWSSFGAGAAEVGAASGLNFYTAEFGNLCVFPGGNSAIAEQVLKKLAASIPQENLRAGSLVFDVTVGADGVIVAYQDSSNKVHTVKASAVVMACPKFVANKILNGIEAERSAAIAKLRYRSYLVANVLIKGAYQDPFYDLYLLGEGKIDGNDITGSSQRQKVTDVILGNFAKPDSDSTVLTLYRGMPFDGVRPELWAPGSYQRYRESFENQVSSSILPLLNLKKENIVDIRVARWGHPLPVAAAGLIADGTVAAMRKPFRNKVFFVEQDNWALPAFETSVTEALTWAQEVKKVLKS